MSLKVVVTCVFATLVSTDAYAGYRELKKGIDSYRPPSYFLYAKPPAAPVQPPARADFEEEADFTAVKKRIMEAKSRWEESLTAGEDDVFLRADAKLMRRLKPAAADADSAIEALKRRFSLESLEGLALLRNPGVKAARNRLQAAIEAFDQVSTLDEILRRYTAYTEGLMTGIGPMKGKDPVQTKFPFPGILALKGQIVRQEVRAARESLEITRREAVTAARKAYWDLLYLREAQKIARVTVDLLKRLESVATTRYEAGKTSFQDVIKVRIQRASLEEDLFTLREKQRNLEVKILETLNLSPGAEIGAPARRALQGKIPPLESLYPTAHAKRQELRRIRARVGKMERMIAMAETMILPSYSQNLSLYQDEAVNQVGSTAQKATFPVVVAAARGAGLPRLPWYGTRDAYLRATRQKLKALRQDLVASETATTTRVRQNWFDLDRARREKTLYEHTVVRLSQAALDVSTRAYESGRVSFADVIASYTTWLKSNLALERKRSDFGIAWAELERTVGVSMHSRDGKLNP